MQALFKCEICGFISTMQLTGVVEKTICPGCRKLTYTDRLTRWEEAVVFLRSIRWRFVAPLVLVSALSGAAAVLALKHLPAPPPAAEEDQAGLAAAFEKALLEEGVPSLRAELAALRGRDARLLEAYGAAFNQTEVVMPYKSWPEVEAVEDPIERLMLQLIFLKNELAREKSSANKNYSRLYEESKLLRSEARSFDMRMRDLRSAKEAYEKEIAALKKQVRDQYNVRGDATDAIIATNQKLNGEVNRLKKELETAKRNLKNNNDFIAGLVDDLREARASAATQRRTVGKD